MPRILVVHGPNLNLLGKRQPEIYGRQTLGQINQQLFELGKSLGYEVVPFQSNSEGEIIDFIQTESETSEGLIINPGAHAHYSYAIRDAIAAVGITAIEVHLTNIAGREAFRHESVVAPVCAGQISGLGAEGYLAALRWMTENRK